MSKATNQTEKSGTRTSVSGPVPGQRPAVSVATAKALSRKANTALVRAKAAGESATVQCAVAMHAAYASGLLSLTRGKGVLDLAKFFETYYPGQSSSISSYWLRLGVALEDIGLDPSGHLFATVLLKGKGAQLGDIGKAIMASGATEESVSRAADVFFDQAGERRETTKTPGTDAASKAAAKKAAEAKAARAVVPPARQAKEAVAILRHAFPHLTKGQRDTVVKAVADMVAKEETLARKAASVKAVA